MPGSIVRVQLRNFVTYDYVEFFPCNYLNMILGPNGTGKSSIACALCIGLNFPPSVRSRVLTSLFPVLTLVLQTMGRATEIHSFVKMGEDITETLEVVPRRWKVI